MQRMTMWCLLSPPSRRLMPRTPNNLLRRSLSVSSSLRRPVVDILEERGLLESLTSDALRSHGGGGVPLKAYCGFDPTAQSLHLGNLLGIVVLSWFQRCGHSSVALIGGATASVGDPSGKSLERPELDPDTLRANTLAITRCVTDILSRAGPSSSSSSFQVLNNYDWWKDVKLLDFLKRVGRFARVGSMMSKESVKKRLDSEQGMSYTEFTYQLLQGYDFLHLYQNHQVNVQIGGSDQWGNITAGTDLIRKILQPESDSVFGLTFPLMLKSDGTKFGKSEDGAVWLSPAMLSPYKFYQYFFSVPDADVVRFLKMLTFLEMEVIHELERSMQAPGYLPNTAQRKLAEEVTRFVHGEDGLLEAIKATEALRPGAETKLDWMTIQGIAEDVPSCSLAYDQVFGLPVVDLSVSSGLLESKSATRRSLSVSSSLRRPVVDILEERGLLESLTSEALRSPGGGVPLKAYCGFDPTAQSLHLGNLLGIVVLSWFHRCGHSSVALIGGTTASVGDPSGKSLERPELDPDTLRANTLAITRCVTDILSRAGPSSSSSSFQVLNNYDWWKDVKLLDFLKRVGRFARVGSMMSKESVKKQLDSEQGMSYTEFTYQLLQGYDFLHLYQNHQVNVQIGGSDQWGNITAGTDLIRKILQPESDSVFGLTFPLMLKSDGTKFGKSEDGAVWLSPAMLSPYKFYQYFFSVPDADVVRFLKMLTFLEMEVIHELERSMQAPGYLPNTAQRKLAEEVTRFVHGEDGLLEAIKATEALRPGAETKLDWMTIQGIAEDVPSCSLAYDQVLGLPVVDLSVSSGLLESKSATRRLLKQGGLYLNNARVDSESKRIESLDIVDGKVLLLSAGKKNKVIVRIS